MSRLVLLLCLAAVAAGAGPGTARAGTECEGLIVCIRAAGPWVQVPGGGKPTLYRFACPGPGQVIGGIDADRAGPLGISFLGALGGPVSPGVTTGRAAVFVAQTTRALAGFRPLLGCIPGGGGGGRGRTLRGPVRHPQAVAPRPEATVWRIKDVRLRERASERLGHSCPAGERLLLFSSAVAFRTVRPPSLAALGSVRARARRVGDRIVVDVRSGVARPRTVRAEVQLQALCARRPR